MTNWIKNIIRSTLQKRYILSNPEILNIKSNETYISLKRNLKDVLFICVGIFSAGFGLKGFLLPNNFIDGGVMGISLLVYEITKIPLPYLIVIINAPFVIFGIKVINKVFTIKTILAILGLAIVLSTVQFPQITNDKLLISIFGGFFLGAGIGLAIRGGSVIDGTEILAIYVSRKTGNSIGDFIMMINITIFCFAAYLLSVETAMYSMLTYLSAAKSVDFIIEGIEEYVGVSIISDFSEDIQTMLKEKLNRGFTVYKQKKGIGKRGEKIADAEIIFIVVTRLEIGKLNAEIEKIDSDAFIVSQNIKNIKGGMIKKRPLHD